MPSSVVSVAEQTPMAVLRRAIEAYLGRGDQASADAVTAADACLHMAGSSELAGEYRGRHGLLGWRERLIHATCGHFELIDVREVAASGDHVVALVRERIACGSIQDTVSLSVAAQVEADQLLELWITPDSTLDRLLASRAPVALQRS
jgi:hypothetical protein